jgi:hypothetical protein
MTPTQRRLKAQVAAHTRWANEPDRTAATAKARAAANARFRNDNERKAHMAKMLLARHS